ncbi:small GTP-binding protein, putative [Trichomonas vaginalis G3]|uniref:Small GTP-binding protein, putative n=1 Tax=Trichomonas vaginalis (strain ATCC PRA-98 / G3) TaxID=412133 RepID=A2EW65_TRIV3|nr:retrograde vesicle-mediated transport, Golgi to ER [Trichomonas vaginalis G3]EAY03101.1 small GTP-binding protein, putative [Trichomonas vaginalis G3]KAI5513710.1 retrograde vesicle-mediated transport, Golgi to ER [Trichomonas vaginalis G3]|eukprot:XP_001315324.1 small GTP-binding protein [Trichomonas vaginalis G3]
MQAEKVIFIGDAGVGKTCITVRYYQSYFQDEIQPTVGANHCQITLSHEGKDVVMNIWDTAGQERYRNIVPLYAQDASLVILVFDVTDVRSFYSLDEWYTKIHVELGIECPFIIVGNKIDLDQNQIPKENIENWTNSHKTKLIYTSARTGEAIVELFEMAAQVLVESKIKKSDEAIQIVARPLTKKSQCC